MVVCFCCVVIIGFGCVWWWVVMVVCWWYGSGVLFCGYLDCFVIVLGLVVCWLVGVIW